MSDSINQRIDKEVYRNVNFIKRWIFLKQDKRYNFSETIEYISQEFIENNRIIKKTDITEQDIKYNDLVLTKYRVDTNMPVELRDDIKIIQYAMNKDRKEEEKKLTMDDVIRTMVEKYMDLYPDIKKLKNEDKYLVQKIKLEELRKKHQGY